jgi:branched-chain amino acid transport system permease protein
VLPLVAQTVDYASLAIGTLSLFGLVLIVALAFNHLLGSAGIPAMSNRIPALIGSFTISAVTLRLTFIIVASAGVNLIEWRDDYSWVYNNQINVGLVNDFIARNPLFGLGILLFSLAVSLLLGGMGGWLMARAAIRLDAIYILILTFSLTDLGCLFGRNIVSLGGGTMGLFIPDPLAFLSGNRGLAMVLIILVVVAAVYLLLQKVEDSPWGRLLVALRDNPTTAASIGKDIVSIRSRAIFFSSGLMALGGTLYSFYNLFVSEAPMHNEVWLFWPLTAIIIGGLGSRRGTILGTSILAITFMMIVNFRLQLQQIFFFPISYLEDIIFPLMMLLPLMFLPRGLIQERRKPIRGIVYGEIIGQDENEEAAK